MTKMSLEKSVEAIIRYKVIKQFKELFLREAEVVPEDCLKYLDQRLQYLERTRASEYDYKVVFDLREKLRNYELKGIKYKGFYDPKNQSVEFRTVQ